MPTPAVFACHELKISCYYANFKKPLIDMRAGQITTSLNRKKEKVNSKPGRKSQRANDFLNYSHKSGIKGQ